jgi:hypothetical protein
VVPEKVSTLEALQKRLPCQHEQPIKGIRHRLRNSNGCSYTRAVPRKRKLCSRSNRYASVHNSAC